MTNIKDELDQYLAKSHSRSGSGGNYTALIPNLNIGKFWSSYASSTNTNGGNKEVKFENGNSNGNSWFGMAEPEKESCCPSLSKRQRVIGFFTCILMGAFCLTMASMFVPVLIFKARKFCLLYSLGSLFILGSFSLLWGPTNHLRHLLGKERIPFTTAYFGTMFATLYCAMWLKSTLFTVLCACLQVAALVWYLVSYIPGGQTGLKFFSKLFTTFLSKTASKTLPV